MTPPPRLVPDWPSDAAIAQAFLEVTGEYRPNVPSSVIAHGVITRAKEIDAAAPPAEAPAEDRFEQYVATLIAKNPDVQKLGERLADWLDEDRFNNIEPILTGIAQRLSAETPAERGDIPTEADALALELVSVTEERDFLRRQLIGKATDGEWVPVKPEGAPYWGIHTADGRTIAGTSSGLSEGDAALICALHRMAAAPAAPAEGDWLPKDNDGKEQDAFEAWAQGEGFDMHQHPLHWLFLNERTSAARKGWRGALAYVNAQAPRVTGGREDAKDAARYRFLRDAADNRTGHPFIARRTAFGVSAWNQEYADNAIDAAMQEPQP